MGVWSGFQTMWDLNYIIFNVKSFAYIAYGTLAECACSRHTCACPKHAYARLVSVSKLRVSSSLSFPKIVLFFQK